MKKNAYFLLSWITFFSIVSLTHADISIKKLAENGIDPQIDNGQVVWSSTYQYDSDIFFWDGQTVRQLTDSEDEDGGPLIDNGLVMWEETVLDTYYHREIIFWDGQTVQQLTDTSENYALVPNTLIFNNGQAVWLAKDDPDPDDESLDYEVFFWDGQTVHQLTDNEINESDPQIDNGQVVWEGHDGHDREIFFWDGQTVHQLTDNDGDDKWPQIDNGQVVWEGHDGHDKEVFFWDGETVHQLTDNDGDDFRPQIDNGQVVWTNYGGHDREIFFWDGQTIHQLTDNEINESDPQIDNGQVVWVCYDGHDDEIFFWDGQTVHQLTDNDIHDRYTDIDNGQLVWQQENLFFRQPAIFYADTRAQSADQVLLFDFGSGAIPTDDDPDNIWNNITEKVGCSNSGKLLDLVTANGETTQIDLVMQRRFNGSNPNGTWSSADFPSSATRDSLFGNTETFNNLSNILPKFKLTGLDPQKTVDVTFYASRMNPKDNRETCYTVDGANSGYATLNPVNNVDTVATVSGIQPNAAGEITIRIAPAKKNTSNKHFTYLSVMKLEVTAN